MTKKRAKILYNKFRKQNQEVSLYIGPAGSGKTTYIARIAYICHLVGVRCFCNVPIRYTIPFTKEEFGRISMNDSVVLFDECGIMYSNRQFKDNFDDKSLGFLKLIRHYKSCCAVFSQANDIDIVWTRMAKNIYMINRSLIPEFTSLCRIKRTLDVNPDTHKIEDFYDKETGFFKRLFRTRFWRRPYYKNFDSWSAPVLPERFDQEEYKFAPLEDSKIKKVLNKVKNNIRTTNGTVGNKP